MKAVLIFDSVNDLIFSKWDETFLSRMKSFNGQEKDGNISDINHVSQLLSPIITSQRVMAAQFSNTYTSMQCKDNTTIVFDEIYANVHHNFNPSKLTTRTFWEYVNMMFNKPDPERIKNVGPDRACAEWVLRNGGKVVWSDGRKLDDYNLLPSDEQSLPKIVEIDGSESSISHYGFPHLSGCTKLEKIILHDNKYIDDRAMKGLVYGHATLLYVQVSKCINVTDNGVKEIKSLKNLKTLLLFNLSGVNDLEECKKYIQSYIPNCKILGHEEKMNS